MPPPPPPPPHLSLGIGPGPPSWSPGKFKGGGGVPTLRWLWTHGAESWAGPQASTDRVRRGDSPRALWARPHSPPSSPAGSPQLLWGHQQWQILTVPEAIAPNEASHSAPDGGNWDSRRGRLELLTPAALGGAAKGQLGLTGLTAGAGWFLNNFTEI